MWRSLALISAFICTPLWAPAQALPPLAEPNATPNDPQVVAGPIPEKITSNSAVVWWETTKPTESILLYGTSRDDLTHRLQKPWPSQTHEASLKSLRPDTTYFLVVIEPNGSSLATAAFTTEPENYTHENTVRVTNGPLFEQITPESAT